MRIQKRLYVPAAISLLFSLSLIGCEGDEGPAGPPGSSTVYITGKVASEPFMWPYGPPPYPTYAVLQISDLPSIPELKVNEIVCPVNTIIGDQISFLSENLPDQPGDSVHLSVNYMDSDSNSHQAWADVMLPEVFSLILPDTSWEIQIPWEEDLELHWEASSGADAYELYFHLSYDYWDTTGEYIYDYYSLDTTIADTHLTIPLAQIMPDTDTVDSTDGGWGELEIVAQNGPWQEGAPGNIQGDGEGFFYGRTQEGAQIQLQPPVGSGNNKTRGSK
ncbi:MAG TPA: hypothetical protein VF398_11120 [bacterium]|jgi:hypothetical protein